MLTKRNMKDAAKIVVRALEECGKRFNRGFWLVAYNLRVAICPDCQEFRVLSVERTNSGNISQCFVCDSSWLMVDEIEDQSPTQVIVKQRFKWNKK